MNKSLHKEKRISLKRKFKINWIPIVLAIILYFTINQLIFFTIGVPSDSMYPTITPGDKIWTLRIHDMSKIKRGDIIVFWNKEIGAMLVKRVIGLPNDKVAVSEDGSLVINGEKLNVNYATSKGEKSGEYTVPADSYFFLGDNLADSYDSRYWKNPFIKKEDIKGKAWVRYYPFDSFGELNK